MPQKIYKKNTQKKEIWTFAKKFFLDTPNILEIVNKNWQQKSPSYQISPSSMKCWPYKMDHSLDRDNSVVYLTISAHLKSGPIRVGGILWEWSYKRGDYCIQWTLKEHAPTFIFYDITIWVTSWVINCQTCYILNLP